jgi:hypothetical protein
VATALRAHHIDAIAFAGKGVANRTAVFRCGLRAIDATPAVEPVAMLWSESDCAYRVIATSDSD